MNSAPLSREQIRLQKAKERKFRNDDRIAREKAWLAKHPEVAEAREREKQAEAEKRHALWLENEEKRKQLSAQVKKKKPTNAFSALIGDDSSDDETSDEEIKIVPAVVSGATSEPSPEEIVRAKNAPMNNVAKKSWAEMMDDDE
jgi:hypothetical protein